MESDQSGQQVFRESGVRVGKVKCALGAPTRTEVAVSGVVRFSVSLEPDLLEKFDRYCAEQKYATRSEAVKQLLRETLTGHEWTADAEDAAATLTIVYDHHKTSLME